jgi:hypothetical protein
MLPALNQRTKVRTSSTNKDSTRVDTEKWRDKLAITKWLPNLSPPFLRRCSLQRAYFSSRTNLHQEAQHLQVTLSPIFWKMRHLSMLHHLDTSAAWLLLYGHSLFFHQSNCSSRPWIWK